MKEKEGVEKQADILCEEVKVCVESGDLDLATECLESASDLYEKVCLPLDREERLMRRRLSDWSVGQEARSRSSKADPQGGEGSLGGAALLRQGITGEGEEDGN